MSSALRTLLATGAPRTAALTRAALRLRTFARPLLLGGAPTPTGPGVKRLAGCSAEAWDLFLLSERCALPLHAALGAREALPRLTEEGRQALERMRFEEIQRVLMGRAQVLQLGAIARELGVPLILLKGGVALTGPSPVDLNDLDVLVPGDAAEALASRLDAAGFGSKSGRPDHHLAGRTRKGMLTVEVHRSIRGYDTDLLRAARSRARPVEELPGVLALAAADHLWHLLVHLGVQHPERRGVLRDELLIRSAARACDDGELRAVRGRIRRHPRSAILGTILDAATGSHGEGGAAPDAFLELAGARSAAAAAVFFRGDAVKPRFWRPLFKMVGSLGSRPDYADRWREILAQGARRRTPMRLAARLARVLLLTAVAGVLAARARQAVRQIGVELDRP